MSNARPRRWNDSDNAKVWADRQAYIRSRVLSPQDETPAIWPEPVIVPGSTDTSISDGEGVGNE